MLRSFRCCSRVIGFAGRGALPVPAARRAACAWSESHERAACHREPPLLDEHALPDIGLSHRAAANPYRRRPEGRAWPSRRRPARKATSDSWITLAILVAATVSAVALVAVPPVPDLVDALVTPTKTLPASPPAVCPAAPAHPAVEAALLPDSMQRSRPARRYAS